MKIEVILPLPVTLNKLTHNNNSKNGGKGGRSKTKRARDWYRDAHVFAMPYRNAHRVECEKNTQEMGKSYDFKKKSPNLQKLHADNMGLSYTVVYRYWFAQERHKRPCDVANFEKQLSDFLVDIGMLLDDSFIDKMILLRSGVDKNNPRVEVNIEKKTITKRE